MTVTTTTTSVSYTGNSSATEFAYTFPIPVADGVVVQTEVIATGVRTTLTDSQYSITGIGDPDGGEVTYPLVGSPLASTHKIIISRVLPVVQETDLTNQDGFYPEVIESALDYLTMLAQQISNPGDSAVYLEEVAGEWDADSKKIVNLAAPTNANDAARKADVDAASIANGNVPAPILSEVGYTLQATGVGTFGWEVGAAVADGSITNAKLANMDAFTIKSRLGGGAGVPSDNSLSAILDVGIGNATGDTMYRSASAWRKASIGTLGQVWTVGASNTPEWATPASASAVPSGAVMAFAMNSPPTGWLKCNGAAVSRATYSDLFTAIGTTFGVGDGSTTFNVPDLRGEWVRGWADDRAVDTGRVFGSAQSEMIGPHNHGASSTTTGTFSGSTSSNGDHTHSMTPTSEFNSSSGGGSGVANNSAISTSFPATITAANAGAHTHTVSGSISASTSTTVTNNSGTENRVRNIALLYCIKT
jgi:microcystin-dependent protein